MKPTNHPPFDPLYHETTRKLKWLVFARWVGVIGQAATAVLAGRLLRIEMHVPGLVACVGFVVLSNAWIHWKLDALGAYTRPVITSLLVVDSLILTGMLYWSGGAHNPFTSFYLLHVTLAAVLLPAGYALGISTLSVVGFVWLYVSAKACCGSLSGELSAGISQDMHFQGMVVSLALTAILITLFVGKIQRELSRSHRLLREAQIDLEKEQRFHSLATLAAGVAHELATPLGTIALVSKEIESVERLGDQNEELLEDVGIIRAEVDRCHTIIERLNSENLVLDSKPELCSVQQLIEEFQSVVPQNLGARLKTIVSDDIEGAYLEISRIQFFSSLHALLKNGCEADRDGGDVQMVISISDQKLQLEFTDHGPAVDDDRLNHLGEPFYTTKSPNEGMGLGLFLVKMFAEKNSGKLSFRIAEKGRSGLIVSLELPLSVARSKEVGT